MNTGRWIPQAPAMWDRVLACRVPCLRKHQQHRKLQKSWKGWKLQLQELPLHQGLPLLVLTGSSNSNNERERSEQGSWGAAAAEPPQWWGTELRAVLPQAALCWQELAGFLAIPYGERLTTQKMPPFPPHPEEPRYPRQLLPPSSRLCWGLLCSAARAGSARVRLS